MNHVAFGVRDFLSVALPMLVCLGVFIAIFIRVSRRENEQALLEFRLRSQQLADTIKATLEEQAGFLEQLSSSFLTRTYLKIPDCCRSRYK